jgi:hypothetical protein
MLLPGMASLKGARAAAAGGVAARAAAGASAGAAAAAVDTSSAVVTRRCTSAWIPPASGTRRGMPMLRTAADTSAMTHHTSCSQTSHTTTERPEHGRGLESVGEQRRRRHGVRDRQPEHRDQGYRGPDQKHEQHRDGAQAGEHVPSGTCPARLAVLPGHQHNAPWLIPHSGVAVACADSWKPAKTPGIMGRVDTVTRTVARSEPGGALQLTMLVLVTLSSPLDSSRP